MRNEVRIRIVGLAFVGSLAGPAWSCHGDGGTADAAPEAAPDDAGAEADAEVGEVADEVTDRGDVPPPELNGRLETGGPIDLLYLWGTRREMGYAEGSLMCGRATRMVRDYVLDYVVPRSGYDYASLLAIVQLTYTFPAGDQAELQGLLDGMRDNCPEADRIVESANLEPAAGGRREVTLADLQTAHALADWACSSVTVWGDASATGRTLHARNLDFYQDEGNVILESHIVKLYSSSEEDGARWLSVSFPGLIGCISCFAEDGTGVTIHNSNGASPTEAGGHVPRMLAARAALAAAAGAADPIAAAEAVLETMPQQIGNNFHFSFPCDAEPCTGGAVFEYDGESVHDDGRVTVRLPGESDGGLDTDRAIACTNHFMKRSAPVTTGSTAERFTVLVDGVNAALASGGLDAAGALALMATTAEIGTTPTVHTVIMDVAAMELQLRVPPDDGMEAPAAPPVRLGLASLFSTLP